MTPMTFDALPDSFHVVRLPDDPRIADPIPRKRGETFTQSTRRRPAAFRRLEGRVFPVSGRVVPDTGADE